MSVLVIAEIGSSHDNDLSKAKRLIDAAKECGAYIAKGQWTSSGEKLAARRGVGKEAAAMYTHYLQKPISWLEALKSHCDSIGIEWACTSYLIEDIPVVAKFVKRFKVSAYESKWNEFVQAHDKWTFGSPPSHQLIISRNDSPIPGDTCLYCVSKYPTALEDLHLGHEVWEGPLFDACEGYAGLSDHTANVLTGAAAVAAGARIVEAHIRLPDTALDNPDFPHSLCCNPAHPSANEFGEYVQNIRTVERML